MSLIMRMSIRGRGIGAPEKTPQATPQQWFIRNASTAPLDIPNEAKTPGQPGAKHPSVTSPKSPVTLPKPAVTMPISAVTLGRNTQSGLGS
jgi:hypothetical protein